MELIPTLLSEIASGASVPSAEEDIYFDSKIASSADTCCCTCAYFVSHNQTHGYVSGTCHRHAPTGCGDKLPSCPSPVRENTTHWPTVRGNDWCGEYDLSK